MTFNCTATGKTKDEVAAKAEAAIRVVTEGQPEHGHDRERVAMAMRSMVRSMEEPGADERMVLECSGEAQLTKRQMAEGVTAMVPLRSQVTINVYIEADPDVQLGDPLVGVSGTSEDTRP
jgi:predicted RNase H-like HicB family nuclease